MSIYTSTQARANLFNLIDETNHTHEPVYIKGKRSEAVILAKSDYEAMQETIYLYSIPGLVDKILESGQEAIDECVDHETAWK